MTRRRHHPRPKERKIKKARERKRREKGEKGEKMRVKVRRCERGCEDEQM